MYVASGKRTGTGRREQLSSEEYFEFFLAETLHKFRWEVLEMPCDEFDDWQQYFEQKHEREKKQVEKETKSKSGKKVLKL